MYRSAHRWPRMTIVSEPFIVMVPLDADVVCVDEVSDERVHAAAHSATTKNELARMAIP